MQRKKNVKANRSQVAARKKHADPGDKTVDNISYRTRVSDDDDFIMELTESQLGRVYQAAVGERFPRERYLRYIQSGAPTYIILKGAKRIGYYSYLLGNDGKMHISALVLEPTYQSGGIGTEVMKRVEAEAKNQGVHTLEVFVQATNTRSLEFTRKLGFVEVFQPLPNTICFHKRIATGNRGSAGMESQFAGYFPYHW